MPSTNNIKDSISSRLTKLVPLRFKRVVDRHVASDADLLIYDSAIRSVNLNRARLTDNLDKPLQQLSGHQVSETLHVLPDIGWEVAGHLDAPSGKSLSRHYLAATTPQNRRNLIDQMATQVLSFSRAPAAKDTWSSYLESLIQYSPAAQKESRIRAPHPQDGDILRARFLLSQSPLAPGTPSVEHIGLALTYGKPLEIDVSTALNGLCLNMQFHVAANSPELLPQLMKNNTHSTNITLAQNLINNRNGIWKHLPEEIKNSRPVYLAAIQKSKPEADSIPRLLRSDKECVLAAVRANGLLLKDAAEELKEDRDVLWAATEQHPRALSHANVPKEKIGGDKEIILAISKKHQYALGDVSRELRNDRDVALASLLHSRQVIKYFGENLKNDKILILAALARDGLQLREVASALKHDRDVVMAAVRENGFALQYAADNLKNDDSIVRIAIQTFGRALMYAGAGPRNNPDIVHAAVRKDSAAAKYIGTILKNDVNFMRDIRQSLEAHELALPAVHRDYRGF